MARTPARKSTAKPTVVNKTVFGLSLEPWIKRPASKAGDVKVRILVGEGALPLQKFGVANIPAWQKRQVDENKEPVLLQTEAGPLWVVPVQKEAARSDHGGLFAGSQYAECRDRLGPLVDYARKVNASVLEVHFVKAPATAKLGALVGIELGSYKYMQVAGGKPDALAVEINGASAAEIEAAGRLGVATNLARHLVNTPANILYPESYAAAVSQIFGAANVEVWDEKRLAKERCGLLVAVGQAADHKPRLVRIRYRPKGAKNAPLAFVGKGVTFDSGGLDIKPSSNMRLMKKDMGGSASVVGLAYWLTFEKIPLACDFYLALAENAVSGNAFRPGDVIQSRGGFSVEIHNTDAEGRLVMADAISVAKELSEPSAIFDLSTLTGAMRVGLGTKHAGLFANFDGVAEELVKLSHRLGDPCWRMPLVDEYKSQLKSPVADIVNASSAPFGGAITAALFLQKFVGDTKWVHLDMYAWTDKAQGALNEVGGNGQMIQALAFTLKGFKQAWLKA